MELLSLSHMGRNTLFAIIFVLEYNVYSNFEYKVPEMRFSDKRKERFQKIAKEH